MKRLWRIVPSLFALVLAPVLLLQGLANARVTPALIEYNPFWLAELSTALLAVEQSQEQAVVRSTERAVAMARSSFAREPLASDALFVLALEKGEQGDGELLAFTDLAASVDKRNRNLGALQLEQAASAGQFARTFAIIDRLAVVHPKLTMVFVRPLTRVLSQPELLTALHKALERAPTWGPAFWSQVPGQAEGIEGMYRLRQMTDVGTSPESDARLLSGLAGKSLYDDAFAFWSQLHGENADRTGFIEGTENPPFGWKLTSDGDRSMFEDGPNRYNIFINGQSDGELARQLVRLDPGQYAFSATVSPSEQAKNIDVTLQCAVGKGNERQVRPLTATARWSVSSACRYYWLILGGSAWESRTAIRAEIAGIRFSSVN